MDYLIPDLDTVGTLSFAEKIHRVDFETIDEMTLIADMGWVRPFGMLVAAIALKQLREKHAQTPFRMKTGKNRSGVSYAEHMGFFQTISEKIKMGNIPRGAAGNDYYLPITKIDLIQMHTADRAAGECGVLEESIEKEAEKLSRILCRNHAAMQRLTTYLIREILRNIPEHAQETNAWICGQYWRDQTAEIAIVDEGIGIKESLRRNSIHRRYVTDDESALFYAIKAGISQAFDPGRGNRSNDEWANSGYGLYMASELCKALDGSFCIASGDRGIYVSEKGVQSINTYLRGTAVKMTFSTAKLENASDMIRQISACGEAEARKIKHAFQKASRPSKELILRI